MEINGQSKQLKYVKEPFVYLRMDIGEAIQLTNDLDAMLKDIQERNVSFESRINISKLSKALTSKVKELLEINYTS